MKTQLVEFNKTQGKDFILSPEEDTQYVLLVDQDAQIKAELNFTKPNVSVEVLLVYCLQVGGSLDVSLTVHHTVPNTSCTVNVAGALNSGSVSNFIGKILIDKKAQQTSSFLTDHVLVLGDGIKNTSRPTLQIEANDVKASHAATTGRVSEEEVYYLMSRGLDRTDCEKIITAGFFQNVLAKISDKKIKEKVEVSLKL